MLNKNEINKKEPMLDNRAVPDHVNIAMIAECMTIPKIKANGEVEGDGALISLFKVKM